GRLEPSTDGPLDGPPRPHRALRLRSTTRRIASRVVAPLVIAGFAALWVPRCHLPSVQAEVKDSVLVVSGSVHPDTIVLRLRAADPNTVEVDVGGDGTADFAFARSTFASINVDGAESDDVLRIDRSNGVFTDTVPTTLNGNVGNDTLIGDVGNETLIGGPGNDFIDGNIGADVIRGAQAGDTVQWDPRD